jgi:hypothetical protein
MQKISWADRVRNEEVLQQRVGYDMRRQRIRRKQLVDDLKEKRGNWNLKEEALDFTLWRLCFGRGYGPLLRLRKEEKNT